MSGIKDFKITDTAGYKVADVPGNTLTGTVAQNKATFDKLSELIITKINNAFDYLYDKNIDDGAGGSALAAYPEDSIYMTLSSASPATTFGGNWELVSNSFQLASGVTCYVWQRESDEPGPTPTSYSLTINANGGTYSGTSPVTVTEGSTSNNNLSIPTRTNYTFLGFYDAASGGTQVYDSSADYVTGSYWSSLGKWIGTADLTVYAQWRQNYTPTPTTYYTISTGVVTNGSSSSTGGSVSGGGTYSSGSTCTLTATASSGYKFMGWSTSVGGSFLSTSNPYSFTVNGSTTYYANFKTVEYCTVQTGVNPSGSGTITGAGAYEQNTYATFTATPATGYEFSNFRMIPQGPITTNNPASLQIFSDCAVVAYFEGAIKIYAYSLDNVDPGGTTPFGPHTSQYCSVSGGGSYVPGDSVTLTATPASGYTFVGWYTQNRTKVSSSRTYTFTASSNVSYWAVVGQSL